MDTKDFSSKKHLADILEEVESLSEPPPAPERLPKQWLPRFLAFTIRLLLLPFVFLDQMAKKIARRIITPPFQKIGQCKRRGTCCYYITMRKRNFFLNKIQFFWMQQIHSFFLRQQKPLQEGKHQYYLLGCSQLKKDGSCGDYRLRPIICRDWPLIEIFGYPKILKGCGYWFVAKKKEYQHVVEEYTTYFKGEKNSLSIINPLYSIDDDLKK